MQCHALACLFTAWAAEALASCVGREAPWVPGAAIFSAADVPQVPGSIQVPVHQVPRTWLWHA